MVLPEEPPAPPPPLPYTRAPEGNAASRRAGGRSELHRAEPPRVLVDVREFRCALPNLLHLHGTRVVPLTLEVGDCIPHTNLNPHPDLHPSPNLNPNPDLNPNPNLNPSPTLNPES